MTDFANLVIKADSTQVRTAGKDLQGMSKSTGALTGAMKALLPALTAVLSVQALTKMAAEAREFGAAIGEVSTLLDDLDQLPRIEKEAKALASEFGGSPTAQVQAFYQAISAGAGNAEEATRLLTSANKLAVGGVTDIGTAVDGLTTIVNAFGLESHEVTGVSDAMFVAMRAGKTTIEELSQGIGKVAPLAKTAGVSFEELLGATASLTKGGIATSEAFTGMKAIIAGIAKPTKEAQDAAALMGAEFDLASLQSKGLQGFLEDLVVSTGGSDAKMLELFGSVEAVNSIFALTAEGGADFAEIMESMADKAGQTDIAFNKIAETMDFKLSKISGKIASTRIVIGDFLLGLAEPIVDNLADNFDDYVAFLSNLVKGTVATIKVMSAALAPFSEAFRLVLVTVGGYVSKFSVAVSGFFESIGVSGLKVSEIIGLTFNSLFSGITRGIETVTINSAAFVDSSITKLKGFLGLAEDTEQRLAAIDMARTGSLEAVDSAYQDNIRAMSDQLIQARLNDDGFQLLEDGTIAVAEETTGLDADLAALSASMGKTETKTGEVKTEVDELATSLNGASTASGSTETSVTDMTAALQIQEGMLQNVQAEWGTLIYDLLADGELNFKSFFDSVVKGFLKMVAQLAAADLAKAVFGGGGLGAITNGTLVNTIKSGASAIFGGGTTAAASGAGTTAATTAAAGAGGTGLLAGIGGGISTVASTVAGGVTAAGSAALTALSAVPVWGWALGGAALLANALDDSGTMSSNAGMLTQDLGHAGSFEIDPFASGAQFTGFARRSDQQSATGNIDGFRSVDAYLTNVFGETIGGSPNLNASDFIGYDEKGGGVGAFFGGASEEGGSDGTPIDQQLGQYASRWITLAGRQNGVDEATINAIIGSGKAEDILANAGGLIPVDGSHAGGLDRVPFDGYVAQLHQGERVQTRQEVIASDSQSGIASQIMMSILQYIIKLFNIVDRWNTNGIPQERTTPQ
jgi:TP901 family phage tail tape measure protein